MSTPSAGFSNGVMCANNVCFDGITKTAQMTADKQIIVGRAGLSPGILTLTAGAGISITQAAGTVTIANAGAGPSWNFINASIPMVADNGYVCVAPGGALVLPLPAVSTQGQEIEVYLYGATSFQITQAANQRILYGNTFTTLGVAGSITSTSQGDSIRMLCATDNLIWIVLSGAGNPTIV